jgi:hypothetical protein
MQLDHVLRHAFANGLRQRLAVDQFRRHVFLLNYERWRMNDELNCGALALFSSAFTIHTSCLPKIPPHNSKAFPAKSTCAGAFLDRLSTR